MRRLGEHRRRVADRADIDGIDTHRLQHRRPELEFDPLHLDAERVEQRFQAAVLLRGEQDRLTLLETDPQQLAGRGGRTGGSHADAGRGKTAEQSPT